MKLKGKNAISLIVLVITILVLSILATTVIISLSNTNIISETSKTVFKSDMSTYKEAYEVYVVNRLAGDAEFDRTKLNVTYQDSEFSDIFGNVSERYKEGLKVVKGELVYESTDEAENEVLEEMGMKPKEYISKDTSYVGYFADTDGDGEVDGVIFADLCVGGSGEWTNSDGAYTIPKITDKTNVKEYYISQESFYKTVFGTHPVLTTTENGADRFYVMTLDDAFGGDWYNKGNVTEYLTLTSSEFGTGKANTDNMVRAWNNETYGEQTSNDIWGKIQAKNLKHNYTNGWFIPSRAEFSAFAKIYPEFYGSTYYYTSTLSSASTFWMADFEGGSMVNNQNLNYSITCAILATTF